METQGKKDSNNAPGSKFGQYDNLQNLISMLTPKPMERKKSDKRDHSEPAPVIRKFFLEEVKIQETVKKETEELESPIIKRFKSKKTLTIDTPHSDSPPEKGEVQIESKGVSIRLFTANSGQTREKITNSTSIQEIVSSSI